jgi:hypothetical protein
VLDAAILPIGGRAHKFHGLVARVFLESDPGRNRKNLLFRSVSPIGLVGLFERGAKRLDRLNLRSRAGEIAAARHPETARESNQGVRLWILSRSEWERGSAGPISAF